ncbi:MAG: hypothetical protein ABI921_13420 [Panacibacter sp.]
MKRNRSIKLKAAFLLAVFALNTVVGFACAIGLNMGFNSTHHGNSEGTEAVVHVHKDGKRHIHQEKKKKHRHDESHSHDEAKTHPKPGSDKDNCCNDKVRNFEQLDKSVPHSLNLIHPIFFTSFVNTYFNTGILFHADIVRDVKPFVRSYHPPIADIRIAIRSFQI